MQISQAVSLLTSDFFTTRPSPQTWADLGCGTGTFTQALAELLPSQSFITAIDQDQNALRHIPTYHGNISIKTHQADFVKNDLALDNIDGILMANVLHYVKDKVALINKLSGYLHENGCFIIVEYETSNANPWVPYPIRFQALKELFISNGFLSVEKLGEAPSRYQGKMYAALIQR